MSQILLQTATPNVESSKDFYRNLGFKTVSESPLIVTDGKAFIEINSERFARLGVKLVKASWREELEKLKASFHVISTPEGYLLSDSSGVWIYLVESNIPPELNSEENSYSILGNYAGLTLETTDIERSAKLYGNLGFLSNGGSPASGFASFSLQGFTVTLLQPLLCPHLFFNPSVSYFNGKNNPDVISRIRSLRIPITEEITHFNKEGIVDNIIVRDPGGLGFFIFND